MARNNLDAYRRKPEIPPTPVAERIKKSARELFSKYGVRAVSLSSIAAHARTNTPYLVEHFGLKEALVYEHVKALIEGPGNFFFDEETDDPKGVLDEWLMYEQEAYTNRFNGTDELDMIAAELWSSAPHKFHRGRLAIQQHKQDYRQLLAELCKKAGYLEPKLLADKLLMLTEGARVCYQSMGADGPGVNLVVAAKEAFGAHTPEKKAD